MKSSKIQFEHLKDRKYFEDLFHAVGGLEGNMYHFDFRDPVEKRKEFNQIRNQVFEELKLKHGDQCQLVCHPECEGIVSQVDHLIPLSSNVLNKLFRELKGNGRKKVPAQSFGSNDRNNFVLACARCNAFKKHRFPSKKLIESIKQKK